MPMTTVSYLGVMWPSIWMKTMASGLDQHLIVGIYNVGCWPSQSHSSTFTKINQLLGKVHGFWLLLYVQAWLHYPNLHTSLFSSNAVASFSFSCSHIFFCQLYLHIKIYFISSTVRPSLFFCLYVLLNDKTDVNSLWSLKLGLYFI